ARRGSVSPSGSARSPTPSTPSVPDLLPPKSSTGSPATCARPRSVWLSRSNPSRSAPVEALTAADVAILDLESPTIAGHTCKVIVLDTGTAPPTIDQVRTHIADRLTRVPRCCECLAPGP